MPKQITTQFASKCSFCGRTVKAGTEAYLDVESKSQRWLHKRCWYRKENPPWAAKKPATNPSK